MNRSLQADLSLLAVSAVWGTSFTLVKLSLDHASPFLFLTLRMLIATLVLLPWALPRRRRPRPARLFPGILVGGFLFAGFAFQILGLRRITPAHSAFLTAFSVIFVPIFVIPIRRRLPRAASLAGVALATGGLYFLLQDDAGFRFRAGDLLTMLCALSFAFHIIGVDYFARREPFRQFALIQLSTAGALAGAATLVLEDPFLRPHGSLILAVGVTSTLCTAGAFAVQTAMQRFTSPTRVAIVYATEPVFAALFSAWVYGERLGPLDILGGGLIFAGMVVAELRGPPPGKSPPAPGAVSPPEDGGAFGRRAGRTPLRRC